MEDRELLELAAKAAGIPTEWHSDAECPMRLDCIGTVPWNPLTSDGDALRLAVDFGLTLTITAAGCVAAKSKCNVSATEWVGHGNRDRHEATRRAIARVAAALTITRQTHNA